MEAVASPERLEPVRISDTRMRAEPVRCTWTGLEDLRSEVRAAIARHASRRIELDDVVQEALLRAARYRNGLSDPSRLRGWVIRIAMNVLRDQMRRDLRLPRVEKPDEVFELIEGREGIPGDACEDDTLESEGTLFEREVVLAHLDRVFEELPRGDRRVLDAFYGNGARRANFVREGAPDLFKVQVFRARARLARALRKRLALGLRADAASRTRPQRMPERAVRPGSVPAWLSRAQCAAGNET